MSNDQANKKGQEDLVNEVVLAAQGRAPNGQLLPGHTANPTGRPKSKPFRDSLLKYFRENPKELDAIILKAVQNAKAGDAQYFKELRDMLDGKPAIAVTGEEGGPIEFSMVDARAKLVADLAE